MSPASVPVGTKHAQYLFHGRGFDGEVSIDIELSEDGGATWRPECGIKANRNTLLDGYCHVGVGFDAKGGNNNPELFMRYRASVDGLVGELRMTR